MFHYSYFSLLLFYIGQKNKDTALLYSMFRCLLTYKALSSLGDVCLILYEAHVWAADHQWHDPYDQDDQLGVARGQSGGQGVQDAHVPGM